MPSVTAYHRPESLDEASSLLARDNAEVLGGGTVVVPRARKRSDVGVELVDLQALGLDTIELVEGRLRIGAMVRLDQLVDDPQVPELIGELALAELPSAMRNQATVGGTVALDDGESVLLAGLMAHDMQVDRVGDSLITAVSIDPSGHGAWAATGRTPADVPIVAAVGRRFGDTSSIFVTGLDDAPVPAGTAASTDDFRGSLEYRQHLADTLIARVSADLEGAEG